MENKYKVTGEHEGKKIDQTVKAYSKNQAKMRAGFKSKLGGKKLSSFMKNDRISIEEI